MAMAMFVILVIALIAGMMRMILAFARLMCVPDVHGRIRAEYVHGADCQNEQGVEDGAHNAATE